MILQNVKKAGEKENKMLNHNHKTAQDRLMDPQLYYRLIFFDFTFFVLF